MLHFLGRADVHPCMDLCSFDFSIADLARQTNSKAFSVVRTRQKGADSEVQLSATVMQSKLLIPARSSTVNVNNMGPGRVQNSAERDQRRASVLTYSLVEPGGSDHTDCTNNAQRLQRT